MPDQSAELPPGQQGQAKDAAKESVEAKKLLEEMQKAQAAEVLKLQQEREKERQAMEAKTVEAVKAENTQAVKSVETKTPERVSLAELGISQLDETTQAFMDEYMTPVMSIRPREQRESEYGPWLVRKLTQIPLLGALVPGEFSLRDIAPTGVVLPPAPAVITPDTLYQLYSKVEPLRAAGDIAGGLVGATLPTAAMAAIVGAGARVAIDGMRWAIGREKTVDMFAREVTRRGMNKGRSLDNRALFQIVFGDRGDISQLVGLHKEIEEGATGESLIQKLGKEHAMRLIRIGFGSNLDAQVLGRLVPLNKQSLLTKGEGEHLKQVKMAYETAQKLFDDGLGEDDKVRFLDNDLPQYLQRREFTNHLKAMAVRSGVAGFKTGVVGAGVSILRGVWKTGLLSDWAGKLGNLGITAVGQAAGWVKDTASGVGKFITEFKMPDLSKGLQPVLGK